MLIKYSIYYAEVVPEPDGDYYAVSDVDALIADLEAIFDPSADGLTYELTQVAAAIAKHKRAER